MKQTREVEMAKAKQTETPIEPDRAYPLHVFLKLANISRTKLRKLTEHAAKLNITLVRDSGTATVLGRDYLEYVAKCGPYQIKPRGINPGPGRGRKKPVKKS